MPEDAAIIPLATCEVNGSRVRSRKKISSVAARGRLVQTTRHVFHRARALRALAMCAAIITLGSVTRGATPPRWAVAVMPGGEEFSLEIAADPASRQMGYMFREKVGPRDGMLFLFDSEERHAIWMKNCRVHLDILWLDGAFRIVDVAPDLPPCPDAGDCPDASPEKPARYVLEIAGGQARKLGLKRNDPIVVLSDPPLH